MTKTHVLGGEISNFSARLCEGIVIVSVCSRQINCIILVLRLLYHSEEPSPATQRKPVTPRNAFPRSSWITRVPCSAKALSLPALLRRCSDMIVIFHGKRASCEAPGCSAVDCDTRAAFISKVSVLFHWRKTSPFIDMRLYSERSAQAPCNGFPPFKSKHPGRKVTLEYFTVAGNISVSAFFNIKEEISRYPGSRPCYSLSSHWSQRWNSHRNKWSRFCGHAAAKFMWSAVELLPFLW